MTTTGKRTKEFRIYLELNQTQLAKELGITPQAVQRVESDNGNFNIETLRNLVFLFGMNMNWYLTGKGKMFLPVSNTFVMKHERLSLSRYDLAKRVNKLRVESDLHSSQMAEFLDINERELAALISGEYKITIELIHRLCEEFDITADWLLFGKE